VKTSEKAQSSAPDAVSATVKLVLFNLPSTFASVYLRHREVVFGLSFIVGALLQALIPPRTYRLKFILGVAIGAAILFAIINTLLRSTLTHGHRG
jgi:hypothetical protein